MSFTPPSGSGLDLAINCSASTVLPRVDNINDAAIKGTEMHEYIRLARDVGAEEALKTVPEEYRDVCAAVDLDSLRKFEKEMAEPAYVYDIQTDTVRFLGLNIGRNYGPRSGSEIGLSLDLVGIEGDQGYVLDYKTGLKLKTAARNWQLRLGALAISRFYGLRTVNVALVYIRDGVNYFDKATFTSFDLDGFAAELKVAHQRWVKEGEKNGQPLSMTTGEHCRYCPSITYCPAQTNLIRNLALERRDEDRILVQLTPETAATAYLKLREYKAALKAAERLLETYAKANPIPLGDDTYYGLVGGGGQERIDGTVAYKVLLDKYGPEAVEKAVAFEASKASLGEAAAFIAAKESRPKAQVLRDILEAIKANDGLKRKEFAPRLKEYTKREQ